MQMNPMPPGYTPAHHHHDDPAIDTSAWAANQMLFTVAGIALAVLLLVLVFAWTPWSGGSTPNTIPDQDTPSQQAPTNPNGSGGSSDSGSGGSTNNNNAPDTVNNGPSIQINP